MQTSSGCKRNIIALVILAELALTALLLIPQHIRNNQLTQAHQRLNTSIATIKIMPDTIKKLEQSQAETRTLLHTTNTVEIGNAEEVIMVSVARALDSTDIALLQLAPEFISGTSPEATGPDSLRIKCQGTYPELVRFLGKLEKQGLFTACRRFQMQVDGNGQILMEAILQRWSEKNLQHAVSIQKKGRSKIL